MVRLVIFDIDGTIVDSNDLHAKAWQVAFAEYGKDISVATIRKQIGKGADQLLPVFFSRDELNRFGEELDRYRSELFKREYLPHVKAFPRARDLFQRIKQDERRIALASSAKQDELDAYKKIAGIDDLVEIETSSGDVEKSKPHPDVFAAALDRFASIAPEEVIVIGDTPYDAQAAEKLHVPVIGVLCGGWSAALLRQAGCLATYQDLADLLEHYDESAIAAKSSH